MTEDGDVCDKMRHREFRCWRIKSTSAIVFELREYIVGASVVEFARFERARREASTSCDGLLEGQRFESMAGKTEADCRGARNGGPPDNELVKCICGIC